MDYGKMGFKCGIEIHQELCTHKLFCSCSTGLKEKNQKAAVTRKLRAVAGESNITDRAALYEMLRDRTFTYIGYEDEFCLVDTDSEPPHPVDKGALLTALSVAKLFKLKIPDSVCVMRKTVTDGSAVSGFQRTMLVGIESDDSFLETSKGPVKINQLNLEEDACKIIKKEGSNVSYSLSRLGIPLLEIGTDASVKDPEHAKEVAFAIGTLLRSFDTVKRGLGTIRQDVNVSIRGGARIEIKGWQDLKTIPLLVENEVKRQATLLEIKGELERRGLDKFGKDSIDATYVFKDSDSKILKPIIQSGGKVYAMRLPKFAGLLKREICPGKTFGRELSEYAKAFGTQGMIHTDEDIPKYRLEKEFGELANLMKAKEEDLILVVAEEDGICRRAIDSLYDRASFCLIGVPEETRIPNHANATSSYARPLPGAHRLYPETDIPNISVDQEMVKRIILPEPLSVKVGRLAKEFGISDDIARELLDKGIDMASLRKEYPGLNPKFIAEALVDYPKEIRRRYNLHVESGDHVPELFRRAEAGDIDKEAIFEILVEIAQGKSVDYGKYRPMPEAEIEKVVKEVIAHNKGAPENAIIGQVMSRLRGKAPGKKVVEVIRKNL